MSQGKIFNKLYKTQQQGKLEIENKVNLLKTIFKEWLKLKINKI